MSKINPRRKAKFKSTVFGEYLMDRYFFKIETNQRKVGKTADLDQKQLQSDHILTIVHEYIHYVHEVSTHIGTVFLALSTSLRAILSNYTNTGLSSSEFNLDISLENAEHLEGINQTVNTLIGDYTLEKEVKQVAKYKNIMSTIKMPHEMKFVDFDFEIPELLVGNESIRFGKFFLYEGLSYELEGVYANSVNRIWNDEEDGTEYTILRYLSKHIVPDISQKTMLQLASLSLSYLNSGAMFVNMLERLSIELKNGNPEDYVINLVKENVKGDYLRNSEILEGVLDEISQIFRQRSSLKIAFDDLKIRFTNASNYRIINPCFEVEMIFDGNLAGLLDVAPPCDYMYVFNNKNKFMRDILGTNRSRLENGDYTAFHHNIFIANIHYANVLFYTFSGEIDFFEEEDEEVCCPFYTACDLQIRKDNPQICAKTPWKTYDKAYASDKKYCWYGNGVGLLKGIDIADDSNAPDTQKNSRE